MPEPRQMNEDRLDVPEANHRGMNMSHQEHLPIPRRLNFLG
jgi:hypothetical protein